MTFKPGFHKAAMAYVRFVGAETMLSKPPEEWPYDHNLITEIYLTCGTFSKDLTYIFQYLAHTELHGWDE